MSLKQYHVRAMILCEGNHAATQRHVEAIARIIRSEMWGVTLIYLLCMTFIGMGVDATESGSLGQFVVSAFFAATLLIYVWAMVEAKWSLDLLKKDPQAWLTDAKYNLITGKDH